MSVRMGFAVLVVVMTASMVIGQVQRQPTQQPPGRGEAPQRTPGVTQSQNASLADAQLAACIIASNENEVALGQLAQQRAEIRSNGLSGLHMSQLGWPEQWVPAHDPKIISASAPTTVQRRFDPDVEQLEFSRFGLNQD